MKSLAEEIATDCIDLVCGQGDRHPQYANCCRSTQRKLDQGRQLLVEAARREASLPLLSRRHNDLLMYIAVIVIAAASLLNSLLIYQINKTVLTQNETFRHMDAAFDELHQAYKANHAQVRSE